MDDGNRILKFWKVLLELYELTLPLSLSSESICLKSISQFAALNVNQ